MIESFDLSALLPPFVLAAVLLVVIFAELIKKIDKKNIMKGYRVYIPGCLSLVMSGLLALGEIIIVRAIPYYWMIIFGLSVFFYEAILRKIQGKMHENKHNL